MLPLCIVDAHFEANLAQLIIHMIKEESTSCQREYRLHEDYLN